MEEIYYVFWMIGARKGLGNFKTEEEAREDIRDLLKDWSNATWVLIKGIQLDRSK